jgi:hypothetical protein
MQRGVLGTTASSTRPAEAGGTSRCALASPKDDIARRWPVPLPYMYNLPVMSTVRGGGQALRERARGRSEAGAGRC